MAPRRRDGEIDKQSQRCLYLIAVGTSPLLAIALLMLGVTWSVQLHASDRSVSKDAATDEVPLH